MNKVDILGVQVDKVDMEQALNRILEFLKEDKAHAVYTPNSEIIMQAYRNQAFRDVLNTADLITPDGIGVVYASRIVKDPLAERVGGFDLATKLIEKAADGSISFYFFGGKPGVAEQAKENLQKKYPGLRIIGCSDGYFDAEKEQKIIADINEKQPDVLFVCLGAPKQEIWIDQNRDKLAVKVCMGLGGSLDVFAGNVKRAPTVFQKLGLEWLYRLCKEPKRIGRMMDLPRFGMTVLLHGRKFPQEGQKT